MFFYVFQERAMRDLHSSDVIDALSTSLENERRLARKLHRRRRSWLPAAFGVIAISAAGIWAAINFNGNSSGGALFVQREQSTSTSTGARGQAAPDLNIPSTIQPSTANVAASTSFEQLGLRVAPEKAEATPPEVHSQPTPVVSASTPSVPAETVSDTPRLRLGREEPSEVPAVHERAVVPSAAALPPAALQLKAPTPVQVDAYLRRARELVVLGDVSAARLVLSRAAEGKDSRALVALAETYDPVVLRRWRVVGMRPDPDRARALYEEASGQGSKTAREHLLAMQ
jgi:hypothetical protein